MMKIIPATKSRVHRLLYWFFSVHVFYSISVIGGQLAISRYFVYPSKADVV